jgi:WD40 repeat protein
MKRPGETLNVTSAVLPHTHSGSGSGSDKQMDVTSLCWCSNGERVATGCYDGVYYASVEVTLMLTSSNICWLLGTGNIWDRRGTHLQKLQGHQGPVFALKFTPSGDLVVSGSYDRRSIVWNTSTGTVSDACISNHTRSNQHQEAHAQ